MTPVTDTWRALLSSALRPVILAVAICLAMFAGCGPTSDRLPISGTITLDSAPLDSGSVSFTSQGHDKLMATGAAVDNGEFKIPQEKGLPPGTYFVQISSPDPLAPPVVYKSAPGEPAFPAMAPERIPAEYNKDRKIEVTSDGDNHFQFDIVRRPT